MGREVEMQGMLRSTAIFLQQRSKMGDSWRSRGNRDVLRVNRCDRYGEYSLQPWGGSVGRQGAGAHVRHEGQEAEEMYRHQRGKMS